MTIEAWAARAAGEPLAPFSYRPGPLGDDEVELAVACCGLCHSDVHLLDDAWKRTVFPFVPGHEVVGTVVAAGAAVHDLLPGARVGVGWQRRACFDCPECRRGRENLCLRQEATCVGHHGGLGERLRIDARFAFLLPDEMESVSAAPLMCGGVTVYAPLVRHGAGPGRVVGVLGVGGLGHLAIGFARALGASVVAFTSSPDKRAELFALGADEVASSVDARALRGWAGRIDLLLSTVPARLDWISVVQMLRPSGILCLVGAAPGLLQLPAAQLITGERTICGSDIGDRASIVDMLRFAAAHRVAPSIEALPLMRVNDGIARLRKNEVRYRVVMEMR